MVYEHVFMLSTTWQRNLCVLSLVRRIYFLRTYVVHIKCIGKRLPGLQRKCLGHTSKYLPRKEKVYAMQQNRNDCRNT